MGPERRFWKNAAERRWTTAALILATSIHVWTLFHCSCFILGYFCVSAWVFVLFILSLVLFLCSLSGRFRLRWIGPKGHVTLPNPSLLSFLNGCLCFGFLCSWKNSCFSAFSKRFWFVWGLCSFHFICSKTRHQFSLLCFQVYVLLLVHCLLACLSKEFSFQPFFVHFSSLQFPFNKPCFSTTFLLKTSCLRFI